MRIINEQYKDKCLYSDFKSDYPSLFEFTALKKL